MERIGDNLLLYLLNPQRHKISGRFVIEVHHNDQGTELAFDFKHLDNLDASTVIL